MSPTIAQLWHKSQISFSSQLIPTLIEFETRPSRNQQKTVTTEMHATTRFAATKSIGAIEAITPRSPCSTILSATVAIEAAPKVNAQ